MSYITSWTHDAILIEVLSSLAFEVLVLCMIMCDDV